MNTLFRPQPDQDHASGAPAADALRIERGRVLVDGRFIDVAVDVIPWTGVAARGAGA